MTVQRLACARAPALTPEQAERFAALARAVADADPLVTCGLNANRRLLISLRYHRHGGTLTIHHGLLDEIAALAEIPLWVRRRGRGRYAAMADGMRAVTARLHLHEREGGGAAPPPALEPLGAPLDLQAELDRIHARWFAHLPKPAIGWGRGSRRRQCHIRFGCYRARPQPLITLHPRLDQPWVARAFVEHVIFHELCHHAQACLPMPGEAAHGRRFRQWEARFPHHRDALAWERSVLHHFLDGTAPPPAQPAALPARAAQAT